MCQFKMADLDDPDLDHYDSYSSFNLSDASYPDMNLPDVNAFYHLMLTRFMNISTSLANDSLKDPKFMDCYYEFMRAETEKGSDPSDCPMKFDGVSCWPKTEPGSLSVMPCFSEFMGVMYDPSNNATLHCHENGSWADRASYGLCQPLNQTELNIEFSKINLIFYIGNTISLIAVLFALWIFISFKDLRCLRNTIHTNLLATYLLHNLFWLSSASLQTHLAAGISCFFFVSLHYSTLTNFMWMFVEGLYLYILVVRTFSVEDIKLRVYVLIGWGTPIPIILTWLLIRQHVANNKDDLTEKEKINYTYEGTCSLFEEASLDWLIKLPVLLVLTVNILFLVRIMWVLITKLRSANTIETQRYWKASKALLVLIPLLGLTYMLLIALPQEFEHFRAILLSTQGFWVSLFYCFLNSEVRNSIRHHIGRWRTERGIVHSREASVRHCRDNSPRTRAGNFSRRIFGGKRESLCCSEVTTMTTFTTNGYSMQSSASPQLLSSSPLGHQSTTSTLQVTGSQVPSSTSSSIVLQPLKGDSSPTYLSASTSLLSAADSTRNLGDDKL